MFTKFSDLPLGARFEFRGLRYEKIALALAGAEDGTGNVFQADAEVFTLELPSPQRQAELTWPPPVPAPAPGDLLPMGAAFTLTGDSGYPLRP